MKKKKVALVMSGGAALGFAHLGVLKVLEEHKIPIDIVVGTSMGGLVGAGYCVGVNLEEMISFASMFRKSHFVDMNFKSSGIFSGKGVMNRLNKFLPDIKIEELEKKYACIACDLLSEKEIIMDSGSIRDAVRSTISIPGIFVPFITKDQVLVDGGIINNRPDDVARDMGADIVISVDVISDCILASEPRNIFETLTYSVNVSIKKIQSLKANEADIILRPKLAGLTQFDFSKKTTIKCIEEGEKEAQKHIEEIKKLIKGK